MPRSSKKTELAAWLTNRPVVLPEHWSVLHQHLAPISDSYLRRLLRTSGAVLHPLIEGVRQDDLATLERTLMALLAEDRPTARRLVIEAKDHAKFSRPAKDEMVLWMLTWLENPAIFPQWVKLRKEALRAQTEAAGT
jgi:hypothetical protein